MAFQMFAGDTKNLLFTISDGTDPLDITDAEIRFQAARGTAAQFSATPALAKAVGSGITVTDRFAGQFTVSLEPADTQALRGPYYLEVEITDAAGNVSTVYTGEMTVLRNLIRPAP